MYGGRNIPAIGGLLLLLCSGVARAEETAAAAKPAAVDPSGSWKWEYSFNDNPAEFRLELNWDGKQLTGKYTAFDQTTDIEEAKFVDGKLSFISKRQFHDNPFTVHFNGKPEANDIVGTVGVDFGDGPREFDWHAKRFVDQDSILGTWKLHLETPQGVIEPQLTITRDGDKLKGHYVSPFGEREAKELAFKDGELSWVIASDEDDDFDFKITYRGKPNGNKIAGNNEFDFNGNTGTMEFTGERTPPKTSPAKEATPADEAKPAAETKPAAESNPADEAKPAAEAAPAASAEPAK